MCNFLCCSSTEYVPLKYPPPSPPSTSPALAAFLWLTARAYHLSVLRVRGHIYVLLRLVYGSPRTLQGWSVGHACQRGTDAPSALPLIRRIRDDNNCAFLSRGRQPQFKGIDCTTNQPESQVYGVQRRVAGVAWYIRSEVDGIERNTKNMKHGIIFGVRCVSGNPAFLRGHPE